MTDRSEGMTPWHRFRCWLGFHDWTPWRDVTLGEQARKCRRCSKVQSRWWPILTEWVQAER